MMTTTVNMMIMMMMMMMMMMNSNKNDDDNDDDGFVNHRILCVLQTLYTEYCVPIKSTCLDQDCASVCHTTTPGQCKPQAHKLAPIHLHGLSSSAHAYKSASSICQQ